MFAEKVERKERRKKKKKKDSTKRCPWGQDRNVIIFKTDLLLLNKVTVNSTDWKRVLIQFHNVTVAHHNACDMCYDVALRQSQNFVF